MMSEREDSPPSVGEALRTIYVAVSDRLSASDSTSTIMNFEVSDTLSVSDSVSFGTGVEQEDPDEGATIIQPFDPTQIRVTTNPMTIDLLLSRIKHGELDLNPGFQRKGGIWTDAVQSRLIESLLIRIPLPAFYFDATEDDRWLVVDGLQRLTALKRFVLDQELKLEGMEFLKDLHGQLYNELARSLQRRIAETQVTLYLIEKGTPAQVKFNIFKRINTAGLPLSAQEIRHALYQGKVTSFLARLAGSEAFKRATNNSIRDDRMADRECVLRFLAFTVASYTQYKAQELDSFLNDTMVHLNALPDEQLDDLMRRFERAMHAAIAIFDKQAFRKQVAPYQRQYPINRALFEAWSVGLDALDPQQLSQLRERKDQLMTVFRDTLQQDLDFGNAISQGTGDIRKVHKRFATVEHIIATVLQ